MAEERQVQELMGAPGSPYTRKMLAVMRFRNIPYRLERQSVIRKSLDNPHYKERAQPKVSLLPTYYFKDENGEEVAVTDSSPLIRRFEKDYEGRSIIPPDPALAFIDMLLEDYGDEWLTKAMFHYRWHYDADIKKAGDILPRWSGVNRPEDEARAIGDFIRERQIDRLSYVGSNEVTKTTIEESFKRYIKLLDAHLTQYPFLMGERPGSADFASYGQLTCLALFDPTPSAVILEQAPRVYAWVEVVEDLSGYIVSEQDWLDIDNPPDTLKAILSEVGRIYVPYLIANAKAVMDKASKLEMTLDGRSWEQNPFTYQAKCLQWLREAYEALGDKDRGRVDSVLEGTGVLQLFG
ncbi:MAG: glutathione S-transferase family protein [Halieaceae bacterium]|jgi:glutathione S-transferase|nr:glutathione S-transferase family protein [Halieaceae bacterium]